MKKIIVPTDFSENSISTGKIALLLADQIHASLVFVYAYQTLKMGFQNEIQRNKSEEDARELAQQDMDSYIQKLALSSGQPYEIVLSSSSLIDVLKAYETDHDVALLVVGTQGASGIKYHFLGSNSLDIARKVDLPVLIVPPKAPIQGQSETSKRGITFFTDFHAQDLQGMHEIHRIWGDSIASYKFIHLQDGNELFTLKDNQLRMENLIYSVRKSFPSANIEGSVEALPETTSAIDAILTDKPHDWVMLTMSDRSFWDRLMDKSLAKKIILNPTNPIFISNRSQNLDTDL